MRDANLEHPDITRVLLEGLPEEMPEPQDIPDRDEDEMYEEWRDRQWER